MLPEVTAMFVNIFFTFFKNLPRENLQRPPPPFRIQEAERRFHLEQFAFQKLVALRFNLNRKDQIIE